MSPAEKSKQLTLVTAYFQLGAAGKTPRDYERWMRNLLPLVQWPLVIFCDRQSVDFIKQLRGDLPATIIPTELSEFSIYRHREMTRAQCREQWPQTHEDVPLVYGEKPNFLRRAAELNPYQSELFFWCDMGMFRLERSCGQGGLFRLSARIEWPNLEICRASFTDKVGFFSRRFELRKRLFKPYPKNIWVTAMFFGGAREPIRQFCDAFYRRYEERAQGGEPIIGEERILRDVSAARPDVARLFPVERIRWLRCLNPYRHPGQWWWYCLNGNRFPWRYFRDEITLPQVCDALFFGFLRRMRDKVVRRVKK